MTGKVRGEFMQNMNRTHRWTRISNHDRFTKRSMWLIASFDRLGSPLTGTRMKRVFLHLPQWKRRAIEIRTSDRDASALRGRRWGEHASSSHTFCKYFRSINNSCCGNFQKCNKKNCQLEKWKTFSQTCGILVDPRYKHNMPNDWVVTNDAKTSKERKNIVTNSYDVALARERANFFILILKKNPAQSQFFVRARLHSHTFFI